MLGYSYGSIWFTYPGLVLTPGRQRLLIGITIRVHVGQFSLNPARLFLLREDAARRRSARILSRMLPLIEGVIARRVLLNFRADADVVQRLLPPPLKVDQHRGHAIVGVCLIRLEHLRPSAIPSPLGLSSENMAHRVAILYPADGGMRPGVFIWRRETDKRIVELLGGRLFPGVHHHARFRVREDEDRLRMEVSSDDGEADVSFSARISGDWRGTPSFGTFHEVSEFFRKGDCGFSCSLRGDELEGLQLKTLTWVMVPMEVESQRSAFFSDSKRFPVGSIEFDCALLMRGVPHEWHQIVDIPELATSAAFV